MSHKKLLYGIIAVVVLFFIYNSWANSQTS